MFWVTDPSERNVGVNASRSRTSILLGLGFCEPSSVRRLRLCCPNCRGILTANYEDAREGHGHLDALDSVALRTLLVPQNEASNKEAENEQHRDQKRRPLKQYEPPAEACVFVAI